MQNDIQTLWDKLAQIPDPEIPVISIVDLGIIRAIDISTSKEVLITITPTYSGCPAMKQIEDDIQSFVKESGYSEVKIKYVYAPAWTSDWISEEACKKLEAYGIAPPVEKTIDKSFLSGKQKTVPCPRCKENKTKMISQFGSTACKALYQCENCLEPFDYFKCI